MRKIIAMICMLFLMASCTNQTKETPSTLPIDTTISTAVDTVNIDTVKMDTAKQVKCINKTNKSK